MGPATNPSPFQIRPARDEDVPAVHAFRKSAQRGSVSLKKKCSDDLRTGVAPLNAE